MVIYYMGSYNLVLNSITMRILVLLALLGSAFAVPRSVSRIVGGSPTNVENYPYMSNMQYGFFGVFWIQFCGGSLLTSTVVLSAAHCFESDPPSLWRVLLGTSLASGGGSQHPVSQIVIHPQYHNLDYDVAIVRLSVPAVYSDRVQPARIPGSSYVLPDGAPVTAIGWGALSVGGVGPEQLQHVDVNVINQELCASRYAFLKTQPGFASWPDVTPGMLCVGILDVGGKDACQGDSGGPLAYDGDIIVGVTSWGYRCADPYYPGVNVRVSYFSDWIVANA